MVLSFKFLNLRFTIKATLRRVRSKKISRH